jgi:hypothetical protein
MSLFKRLFGGAGKETPPAPAAPPETYNGFEIYAEPRREGDQYRVAARIEKDVEGTRKVHSLVRADTMAGYDDAVAASVNKAKQMINEQGERLFG